MRKSAFIILLTAIMLALTVIPAYAAAEISVYVDGKKLNMDVSPTIMEGRTMVPVRAISEAVGCEVEWLPSAGAVVVYKPGTTNVLIGLNINDRVAYVYTNNPNGDKVAMDAPAVIINGRTLVPLRFIAETLGFSVGWNDASRTAALTSPGGKAADTRYSDAEIERVLTNGEWMDMNVVASGYGECYAFYSDFSYTWGGNQMVGGRRELFASGFWDVKDGVLYLTPRLRYAAEGGWVEKGTSAGWDTLVDADYVIRLATSANPSEWYAVGIIGKDPAGSPHDAISLDGQYWYNYSPVQDLMEDYRELTSRIGWIMVRDVKGPVKVEQDVHSGGKSNYISGVLQKGAFYHDERGEWLTYYYVEVGANQYKYLSGGYLPSSKPYEAMVYSSHYSADTMKKYLGKFIYFIGESFEANTIYHRRDIVVDISEMTELIK